MKPKLVAVLEEAITVSPAFTGQYMFDIVFRWCFKT